MTDNLKTPANTEDLVATVRDRYGRGRAHGR
jgi:hypothetical protein